MNLHAGRLGAVWQGLVLGEVVRAERPTRYAETSATAPSDAMPTDAERRYGLRYAAGTFPRPTTFLDVARPYLADGRAPGSAAVALAVVPDAEALLASTDAEAVADLRAWAAQNGVPGARAVVADGALAVPPFLGRGPALVVVDLTHPDPLDDLEAEDSPLTLAADAAADGHGLVLFYGVDTPDDRGWALDALALPDLWQGDLLVATADGETEDDGDLALGTTPGVGWGVVLANVDPALARRCGSLGEALVACYEGVPLPDGRPGALDLLVDVS